VKSSEDKHRLVIDPPAAKVVRRIFDMTLAGFCTTEIARTLNLEDVPSPLIYMRQKYPGKKIAALEDGFWNNFVVLSILYEERYTGKAISLTDLLDGYVARHYNQVSDFGKFADPLADKCLVMAALCWFVETGDMVGWVLAVVLLREFAVSGMRLIAVEKGRVIAAGWSGKVKTASTMVCICLMLFGIPHWLNLVCQGVILVTTVYSGVEYFAKNWDVFQENK